MYSVDRFTHLRDSIVAKCEELGFGEQAGPIAARALEAHVAALNLRLALAGGIVEGLPTGKDRTEALTIFYALEAEHIRRAMLTLKQVGEEQ